MKLIEQTFTIRARPETVYRMFTEPALFVQWMAEPAELVAAPGGTLRWRHANGDTCAGEYLELEPFRRIVFSYGWEREEIGIAPGSTRVTITIDSAPGGSRLRLVHEGLPAEWQHPHGEGWAHYLGRLTRLAEGEPPSADDWTEPVPTRAEIISDPEAWFAAIAAPLLAREGVDRSTMMGMACLRRNGHFFATWPKAGRALILKFSEGDVNEMVEGGRGDSFAPNGRRFREWVSIPWAMRADWPDLLLRAHEFAGTATLKPARKRKTE